MLTVSNLEGCEDGLLSLKTFSPKQDLRESDGHVSLKLTVFVE